MKTILHDAKLVAACGLYCGSCGAFQKGRCPGCAHNIKATWCKVRTCNHARSYSSCADCKEYANPQDCKKFNNPMSRVIGFLLRSNRAACINRIKNVGLEGYSKEMAESQKMTLRK